MYRLLDWCMQLPVIFQTIALATYLGFATMAWILEAALTSGILASVVAIVVLYSSNYFGFRIHQHKA